MEIYVSDILKWNSESGRRIIPLVLVNCGTLTFKIFVICETVKALWCVSLVLVQTLRTFELIFYCVPDFPETYLQTYWGIHAWTPELWRAATGCMGNPHFTLGYRDWV